MSFLFGGRPQLSSAEKVATAELEIKMFTDIQNRLLQSCSKKCIPQDYREGELNKGESVCLDRCVSKFFDVSLKVGEKMQAEASSRQGGAGAGAGLGA